MPVIYPSRDLNFGDPLPVAEDLRKPVLWIGLAPELMPPTVPPLQQALDLLVRPEDQLPAAATIHHQPASTPLASQMDDEIAAFLLSRFNGRSITEIRAMGGIRLDDFTNSVANKEMDGRGLKEGQQQGRQVGRREGRLEGRQAEAAAMTPRLLQLRRGPLSPDQQSQIQALPLADLEALAEAPLDLQRSTDLTAWVDECRGSTPTQTSANTPSRSLPPFPVVPKAAFSWAGDSASQTRGSEGGSDPISRKGSSHRSPGNGRSLPETPA